ncbi:hypothetical protein LINPERPRIM_LOCUS7285 [Linum perenne]
MNSLSGSGM